MKLSKLTIRNWKGIEEISINIENISVIIGPNNSSKSSILQALQQFGSADKTLDESYYHKHDTSKPISFHATFTEITPEEAELHGIKVSLHESGKFIVRAIYKYKQEVIRSSKLHGSEDHDLLDDGWDGKMGGGKGSHFINVFPDVLYVPAVKDANDELKNTSGHMKTLSTLYKEVIHSLDEYKEAEMKTKLLQNKINSHDDEKIRFFESEVQTFLKDVTSTKISFNVSVEPLADTLSTSVKPFFNFNGIDTELNHQGSGVQRTFLLSILKGYRLYKKQYPKDEKEKVSYKRPLIVAIEEPELYLHPQLARIFKDTLYGLADEEYFQVIATSHSTNFVDLTKPNRTLAKITLEGPEKKVTVNQVNSDIYGIPQEEKDRFQALLRFNPYVNEVFFAERVILVEGDTEIIALKLIGEKLIDEKLMDADLYYRTSIVNCGGKGTMYVVQNVLNNFNVKYTVIHDYDIAEENSKGERRSSTTLQGAMTLNHKIEKLAEIRGNSKFVFQYTFEEELPPEYEKGSSKSFAAYEFLNNIDVKKIPERLKNIVRSAFGVVLDEPLDHRNETLLNYYNWTEMREAKQKWKEPKDDFIIKRWV